NLQQVMGLVLGYLVPESEVWIESVGGGEYLVQRRIETGLVQDLPAIKLRVQNVEEEHPVPGDAERLLEIPLRFLRFAPEHLGAESLNGSEHRVRQALIVSPFELDDAIEIQLDPGDHRDRRGIVQIETHPPHPVRERPEEERDIRILDPV